MLKSWSTIWFCLIISVIGAKAKFDGGWWSGDDDQELDDERRDAEILKAVQDSMIQYEARRNSRSRHKRAEPSICYPPLGCFSSSGPFTYLDMLPATPDEVSTTFLLYPGRRTPRSVTLGDSPLVEVPFSNISDAFAWARKHFNASKPTKVLVHGFGSSCHYVWVYEMRSALMSVDDFNIVCVDWENGAVLPNYVKAVANTRLVGKQLAMLLRGLEDQVGLKRETMHLIGFSLGAHVAGFAGSELKNISRITGLDPAGPLFESQVPDARLDSTDAIFVDVIHSNGENLFLGGLGSWQPMGHVDFYPNGGRMQKGCSNLFVGAVSDFIWSSDVEGRSLCNHRRAYKFFVDSVSPRCHFPAFPCESYDHFIEGRCFPCTNERHCGNMGYYADKSIARGQLFLITRDEEPFCAHQYSVKIESSTMSKPLINYGKIKITLVGESDLNETFTMTSKDDEQLLPGEIVSRILVPHPIIAEPSKVEILYQGYSGWLTSGFKRWKIDKVSMMDSFGKTSSVCKKGLELESGVPITLRLYPGNCNIPKDGQTTDQNIEDRIYDENLNKSDSAPKFEPDSSNRKFIPTPVVKIGNEAIKNSEAIRTILQSDNEIHWNNNIDQEIESTRSFKTKSDDEISEPVLRKPANKNARSHDLSKPEITEPILGSTTVKTTTHNLISRVLGDNFDETDWEPQNRDAKYKRHDYVQTERTTTTNEDNPLKMIIMTVQFLPQRLSRMFEQAEKYARETIFPLISQHTPTFISNIIQPKGRLQPKYVPLNYDETTNKNLPIRIPKSEFVPPDVPVKLVQTDDDNQNGTTSALVIEPRGNVGPTSEKIQIVYPEIGQIPPNSKVFYETSTEKQEQTTEKLKKLVVDLPVFDERDIGVKYIPLNYKDNLKPEEITK